MEYPKAFITYEYYDTDLPSICPRCGDDVEIDYNPSTSEFDYRACRAQRLDPDGGDYDNIFEFVHPVGRCANDECGWVKSFPSSKLYWNPFSKQFSLGKPLRWHEYRLEVECNEEIKRCQALIEKHFGKGYEGSIREYWWR